MMFNEVIITCNTFYFFTVLLKYGHKRCSVKYLLHTMFKAVFNGKS